MTGILILESSSICNFLNVTQNYVKTENDIKSSNVEKIKSMKEECDENTI